MFSLDATKQILTTSVSTSVLSTCFKRSNLSTMLTAAATYEVCNVICNLVFPSAIYPAADELSGVAMKFAVSAFLSYKVTKDVDKNFRFADFFLPYLASNGLHFGLFNSDETEKVIFGAAVFGTAWAISNIMKRFETPKQVDFPEIQKPVAHLDIAKPKTSITSVDSSETEKVPEVPPSSNLETAEEDTEVQLPINPLTVSTDFTPTEITNATVVQPLVNSLADSTDLKTQETKDIIALTPQQAVDQLEELFKINPVLASDLLNKYDIGQKIIEKRIEDYKTFLNSELERTHALSESLKNINFKFIEDYTAFLNSELHQIEAWNASLTVNSKSIHDTAMKYLSSSAASAA